MLFINLFRITRPYQNHMKHIKFSKRSKSLDPNTDPPHIIEKVFRTRTSSHNLCCRSGSGAFLTPGSGMGKRSGSGNHFLWCGFGSGIRNIFDPGSGMEKIRIRDPVLTSWIRNTTKKQNCSRRSQLFGLDGHVQYSVYSRSLNVNQFRSLCLGLGSGSATHNKFKSRIDMLGKRSCIFM